MFILSEFKGKSGLLKDTEIDSLLSSSPAHGLSTPPCGPDVCVRPLSFGLRHHIWEFKGIFPVMCVINGSEFTNLLQYVIS
jgi:hypothetical protein